MNQVERLIDEQQRYYKERSGEYEEWIRSYMEPVREHIVALMRESPLRGEVLEIACGTGYWTEQLSQIARQVTAIDGAAEMLDIVASRKLPNVTLVQEDLFHWEPERLWDAIFFVHWLAHIPPQEHERFWGALGRALRPGGKVMFVDVTASESRIEERTWKEGAVPVILRRLNDGRSFTVVKNYWDPPDLIAQLRQWEWSVSAVPVGAEIGRGFVYYTAEKCNDE